MKNEAWYWIRSKKHPKRGWEVGLYLAETKCWFLSMDEASYSLDDYEVGPQITRPKAKRRWPSLAILTSVLKSYLATRGKRPTRESGPLRGIGGVETLAPALRCEVRQAGSPGPSKPSA